MRILFLTQIIPYPPDSGPKVKTWHVLRYLAERGHQITLASFVRPDEVGHIDALRQVCNEVHTVPIRRSRLADLAYWLRSLATGRPFLIERDDLAGMRRCIYELRSRTEFDVIHADQLSMAQFAFPSRRIKPASGQVTSSHEGRKPKLVFDAHNAVWTLVERMAQAVTPALKPVLRLEARRVKAYEAMLMQAYDHVLAVTEIDRQLLLQTVQESSSKAPILAPITVIPIAIDAQALQPVQRKPNSLNVLTLGTLHYPPNADGIRWFVREVFPLVCERIPESSLTIVGKNPPQDFLELAASQPERIRVTGYVPELTPYFQQAALMVVPVRAGSGMRVRILEAFARGMPMVTTTVGLEGIDAKPGEHILVADTADEFARAVVSLLNDARLQDSLAEKGRRLAETRYDWRVVLSALDKIYGSPAQ